MSTTPAPGSSALLRLYIWAVVAIGGVVLAVSLSTLPSAPRPGLWLGFAALAVVAGTFTMKVVSVQATVSVSDTFFIASAMLFGPAPATLAVAVASFIVSRRRRHHWQRLAFNTAAPSLSMWAASAAFFQIARVPPLMTAPAAIGVLAVPLVCLTAIYFVLNSGLTAAAIGLDLGESPLRIWWRHFSWLSLSYLAAGSVAFCLILLIQGASLFATALVLPLLVIFQLALRSSFGRLDDARRHLNETDRLYRSTIETLAMAIDAKDDVTHSHVRRVQAYAVGLARALGMADEASIKAIEAAALLHDTGKLAVPEHILNKPGRLTSTEFDAMKRHVDVGADILSLVEFPYPVVPIVRCHHESWDGSGYPRGVKGTDIPIGARILSVVDCFDALTSDRPYRARLDDEAALDILRSRRGTMYDPLIVDTFIRVYRTIPLGDADGAPHREVMQAIGRSRGAAEQAVPAPTPAASCAGNDVLAFVSLARLTSGEAGAADVFALASPLVAALLPGATTAWYRLDGECHGLTVVDAVGPAAAALGGLTIPVGDRLTGWVAANRRTIVNSEAALDLGLDQAAAHGLASCLSVPLLAGDALVGVVTMYADKPNAFSDDDVRTVQMIAPHVAQAVRRTSADRAVDEALPSAARHAAPRDLRLVVTR